MGLRKDNFLLGPTACHCDLKSKQSYRQGEACRSHATATYLPSLMSIAEVALVLERVHTHTQTHKVTDATDCSTHACAIAGVSNKGNHRLSDFANLPPYDNKVEQLYKNISMLFLFPVKEGKLSTGVNATFNASCYG